jgi:hypothetical protein
MRYPQRRLPRPLAVAIVVALAWLAPAQGFAQHGRPGSSLQRQLAALNARLDNLYVPFKVQIAGGLCDSAPSPSSNPRIIIDSSGRDAFTVTSILIKRGPQNPVDFLFLTVNGVAINGTYFETRTGNLFDPLFGEFAVEQSADIMGMPVRRGGLIDDPKPGGNVPHQIVAYGGPGDDINVQLFCRSDDQDLEIETIVVAGWKKTRDTISVSYVPGN